MNPSGGQSYHPSYQKHKELLKEVAQTEQDIIDKNMRELKLVRPFLFKGEEGNEESESDKDSKSSGDESGEAESNEDDDDISVSQRAAPRNPVDRTDIKDKTTRNREQNIFLKQQKIQ